MLFRSSSSTSPGESLDSSDQVAKKKKKKTKKKNFDKREAKAASTASKTSPLDNPPNPPRKVKYPCMLCTGDHLLQDFPGIPKVLEVWSNGRPPLPVTSRSHVGGTSSASAGKTLKKQGKLTNPYKLCEGHHAIHLCPYMDEAKRVLENSTISTPCLLVGYKHLSLSPPLADALIGQESSLVDLAPPEIQIQESVPDQPLIVGSVELALSVVH